MVGKVDEGFCILVLTNYWNKWWAMVEGEDEKAVQSIRTKWTDEGKGANARLNGGWSKEGRGELGRIVQLVMADRSDQNEAQKEIRQSFENNLLDYYRQKEAAKKGKKRKAVTEPMMLDNEDYMDDLGELLGGDDPPELRQRDDAADDNDDNQATQLEAV